MIRIVLLVQITSSAKLAITLMPNLTFKMGDAFARMDITKNVNQMAILYASSVSIHVPSVTAALFARNAQFLIQFHKEMGIVVALLISTILVRKKVFQSVNPAKIVHFVGTVLIVK